MSSETDHPRQRTVAELLAEHGNGGPSGRRRRRREEEPDEGAPPGQQAPIATRDPVAPFAPPDRAVLRDPVPPARVAGPDERRAAAPALPQQSAPQQSAPQQSAPRQSASQQVQSRQVQPQQVQSRPVPPVSPPPVAAPAGQAPVQPSDGPAPAAVQPPTVQAPPVAPPARQAPSAATPSAATPSAATPSAATPSAASPSAASPSAASPSAASPATTPPATRQAGQQQASPQPTAQQGTSAPPARPAGPERDRPTDVMPRYRDAPQEAEDLFTRPIPQQKSAPDEDVDEGPPTMVGAAPVGAESWHRARTEDAVRDGSAIDGGPPLPEGPVDAHEEPAGLGPVDPDEFDDGPPARERRLGRGSAAKEAAAPSWAAVMVQWIAGALGGAVLWVLFRFLWRNLPVVALASAVLVTVGLVVIVRALLHNDDRRTTIFAVLVGLLLTVSPAILVLMGR